MSSCFADERVSIPGSAAAILRNSGCMITVYREVQTNASIQGKSIKALEKSESDLDVEPGFRAGFDEHDVEFFGLALSFLCGHLSAASEAGVSDTCMLYQSEQVHRNERCERRSHLLSTRSVLFPTSTTITSPPLSVRTSSIHFEVFRKDCLSAQVNISENKTDSN